MLPLTGGEADVSFCGLRPPGHHAEPEIAMGFCLCNNVAVAARHAIESLGVERIFILDWDVHHGNGTNDVFHADPRVLFASIHQSPLYPWTGPLGDVGSGEGEGYTINLPVPPGSGEPLWLALLERVVMPAARAFEPQLILVSAGFDAHAEDPLANCRLSTESFVEMSRRVRSLARGLGVGLGAVLEGGYNERVLAECMCATLPALAGDGEARAGGAGETQTAAPSEREQELIARALAQHSRHWPL